jgi:hypothetical protein
MSVTPDNPHHEDAVETDNELIIKLLRVIVAQNNEAFNLELNEDDIED